MTSHQDISGPASRYGGQFPFDFQPGASEVERIAYLLEALGACHDQSEPGPSDDAGASLQSAARVGKKSGGVCLAGARACASRGHKPASRALDSMINGEPAIKSTPARPFGGSCEVAILAGATPPGGEAASNGESAFTAALEAPLVGSGEDAPLARATPAVGDEASNVQSAVKSALAKHLAGSGEMASLAGATSPGSDGVQGRVGGRVGSGKAPRGCVRISPTPTRQATPVAIEAGEFPVGR